MAREWNEHSETDMAAPVTRRVATWITAEQFAEFQKIVVRKKTSISSRLREMVLQDIEQYGSLD